MIEVVRFKFYLIPSARLDYSGTGTGLTTDEAHSCCPHNALPSGRERSNGNPV